MTSKNGYLRLKQIIPDLLPISKSSWWQGVKEGRFPAGIKLTPRTTAWRVSDIEELLDRLASTQKGDHDE